MSEKLPKKPLQPAVGTEFEWNASQIDGFLALLSEHPGEYVCLLDGTLYSNVPESRVEEILAQALSRWR
jgi:hypothetical protein